MTTIYTDHRIARLPVHHRGLGVVATDDIPKGTLLNIDFLITGSIDEICEKLRTYPNRKLLEQLYPRSRTATVKDKIIHNIFNCGKGHELGEYLSFYNHSCQANAVHGRWVIRDQMLAAIFARRDIPKGDEINLFYGVVYGHVPMHPHEINCQCSLVNMDIRKKIFTKLLREGLEYMETSRDKLTEVLRSLLKRSEGD